MNENNGLKSKGKVAFVTAASSGIGAAIVEALDSHRPLDYSTHGS